MSSESSASPKTAPECSPAAGEIEMVTVRRTGLINGGIRLYRAQSIRDFINRNSRRRPQEPLEPGQVAKEDL